MTVSTRNDPSFADEATCGQTSLLILAHSGIPYDEEAHGLSALPAPTPVTIRSQRPPCRRWWPLGPGVASLACLILA